MYFAVVAHSQVIWDLILPDLRNSARRLGVSSRSTFNRTMG